MRSLKGLASSAASAAVVLFALAVTPTLSYAQNEQVGDLNTSTTNSTVSSNNPSTTNNYNGAGAASDVIVCC